MPQDLFVALTARGRGIGPDPETLPSPTEFRKIPGGEPGLVTHVRALLPAPPPPPPPDTTPNAAVSTFSRSTASMLEGEDATMTVQLRNAAGDNLVLDGVDIFLATNLGTLTPTSGVTAAGVFSASFTSAVAGTATITAYLGTSSADPVIGTVQVSVVEAPDPTPVPDAGQSTVSASPTWFTVGESSSVTVQLRNATGDLITESGDNVLLATNLGTLTPAGGTTINGVFQGTLTGATAGTATVTAYLGTTTGDPVIGTAEVILQAVGSPPQLGVLNNNLPDAGAGWILVTDQDFGSWPNPVLNGWQDPQTGNWWSVATNRYGEDPTIVSDPTAPSGNGLVFRQNYEGVPDGREPKFPVTSLGNGLEFFMGFYVKFLSTWTNPITSGIKWHIPNAIQNGPSMSAGWLGMSRSVDPNLDPNEPSHGWVFNGTCAELNSICGIPESDNPNVVRFKSNPSPSAAGLMTRGEWHKVQYYLSKTHSIVRVWIDDVLIINRREFTWNDPLGAWQSMQLGATWGGAATPNPAPAGNIIYYDKFVVYRRSLLAPPPPPPPPPAGVIWASDWSTATGRTASALTDGGQWTTNAGTGLFDVFDGGGIPAPAPPSGINRVLRCQYTNTAESFHYLSVDLGSLNLMSLGQSWYQRWYYRLDSAGPRQATHYDTIDVFGYRNLTHHTPDGTGDVYRPVVRVAPGGNYPFTYWKPGTAAGAGPLIRGVWYRLEFHCEIIALEGVDPAPIGSNHGAWTLSGQMEYRIHPRVYLGHGTTPIRTAADYLQEDYPSQGTATLASYYAAGNTHLTGSSHTVAGVRDDFRRLGIGNNGSTTGVAPETNGDQFYYYAAMAVSLSDWIGPAA